uniref:Polymerase nucleotidyl transferase domain-containing protein n=1 Tax=Setaria digitata TaxID=48799 RepID=A0A915PWE2_9BILA
MLVTQQYGLISGVVLSGGGTRGIWGEDLDFICFGLKKLPLRAQKHSNVNKGSVENDRN